MTEAIERQLELKIRELTRSEEPAHDFSHFARVVKMAKAICAKERGDAAVVVPAAWLHDFVIVPKSDPRRKTASRLSADAAIEFLKALGYPDKHLAPIHHAIEAHSFSASIETRTLDARIVQDADRLDGLGAIGVARCFSIAGQFRTALYSGDDAFCTEREADDRRFAVDHFYVKLLKVAYELKTEAGRAEGAIRAARMRRFLEDLSMEI